MDNEQQLEPLSHRQWMLMTESVFCCNMLSILEPPPIPQATEAEREPVQLRRRARSRRRCRAPADAGGAADSRRRWQQREQVPLQRQARSQRRQQREAAVAASGGGEIKTQWLTLFLSRTCKRGSNQAARRDDPDHPRTGSNNQQDKCQDKRDKISG